MRYCRALFVLIIFTAVFAEPSAFLDSLRSGMPDIHADPAAYNEWKIEFALALHGMTRPPLERPMEPMDWRVENGYVVAYVDETSGEFEEGGSPAGTGAYRKLTYSYPSAPGTGYIIYCVDDDWAKTQTDMPNTSSNYMLGDTVYSIWANYNGVYIRQEITPVRLGGDPGENEQIRFKTVMKSADGDCHTAGCLVFYDTMLDDDDAAEISTAYGYTGRAEIFFGDEIPAIWRAYQDGYPPRPGAMTALGILMGFEAEEPDVFWYGSWPLGSGNGWDDSDWIIDSGGTFGDSATMVKWYQRTVCPGDSVVYVTYYGIGEITAGLDLTVSAAPPPFTTGCTQISPNPFTLNAMITNPGATDATNIDIELMLPPGLSIVAGDNPHHLDDLAGYGGSRHISWVVSVDPSAFGASACYDIEITWDEGGPVFRTYCPFIPALNNVSIDIETEFESLCLGQCTQLRAVIDTSEALNRDWSYTWRPSAGLSDTIGTRVEACPMITTTYWCIVSDGSDCIDSTSVTISIHENPIVHIDDTTICRGHSVTIAPSVVPDDPGNTFLWFPGGETTSEITVSPDTTTTYEIVVISPAGCFSADTAQVIIIECDPPYGWLVGPQTGAWSACADQDIRLVVNDLGELDTMSIRLTVDGSTYAITDPELALEQDSILIFSPPTDWTDGDTVVWSLDSISNYNWIAATELPSGFFFIDLTAPEVLSFEPPTGAILETPYPTIRFTIADFLSGIDTSLMSISINDETFPLGATGLECAFYGDTLSCTATCSELGLAFLLSDTVRISIASGDKPDYCPPNMGVFSWWFFIDLGVSCNQYPNPITPNSDGINDIAVFDYPLMFTGPAELSIFDMRNNLVYRAEIGPAVSFLNVENRVWDGTDLSGNPVKEGLYIYTLQKEGQIVCNGTITLVR